MKSFLMSLLLFLLVFFCVVLEAEDVSSSSSVFMRASLVKKEERRSIMVAEYGKISAVDIPNGSVRDYHLEFFTLEPNSLFLPVILHSDMVFYVHTGSGKLSWAEVGKELKGMDIKKGDVYSLHSGSLFYMQSDLDQENNNLRIFAIFSNADEGIYDPSFGAYSSINDLILGFDRKVLGSAFKVPEEVIEEMTRAMRPPGIIHAMPEKKPIFWEIEEIFLKFSRNGHHKKTKTFNILDNKPDFANCNGWSMTVDKGDLKALKGSGIGVFMVNLTKGSMMGPHWNPVANEIAIVLQGQGMIRVVCPSNVSEVECKNMRFRVQEGDVFAIPRFHPMAQMAFNNGSLVFMGFSTSPGKNYPQFLAGKRSVLLTLNKEILALSFNVENTTIDRIMTPQEEAIILECTTCAEEEWTKVEDERKKEREKEEEEEEARKREEEERKREEEEERKRREEERKREEEEERKRKEERKREEEERKRREERKRKREEEEEERKRREEERKKREEDERKREEEEEEEEERKREEKRRKEEEERRREAEERQREAHRRQEAAASREQEQARKEEAERQRQRERKEAAAKERGRGVKPEEETKRSEEKEEEQPSENGEGRKAPREVWKL